MKPSRQGLVSCSKCNKKRRGWDLAAIAIAVAPAIAATAAGNISVPLPLH